MRERKEVSLAEFVEKTAYLKLDPWQNNLCEWLQWVKEDKGLRWLIHAPPQSGKSVILSQRLPAWILGFQPELRIKLACYNIAHATRFSRTSRELMESEDYAEMFPDELSRLAKTAKTQEEWSTLARERARDSQPSLKALGLMTGFVGQGADLLIIDDPYASPQDAYSEVIRDSVWTFWADSAKPRLNPDANVIVMFHRYHLDDLAGRLMREEGLIENGGKWQLLRYAAIADGEGHDPIKRPVGEKLSPRMDDAFLEEQQRNSAVWLGQFQGVPISRTGSFFRADKFEIVDDAPEGLPVCRGWDMAATEGSGDYTAGVKMAGPDAYGYFYVLDVQRGQWSTDRRNRVIREAAERDGEVCWIRGAQDPGSAGVDSARAFRHLLAGYLVQTERVSGAKEVRADPLSSRINSGDVRLVRGGWNRDFIEEFRAFPRGRHDDQIDAAADAFTVLARRTRIRVGRVAI